MKTFKHILVPTDFEHASRDALEHAVSIAKNFDARVDWRVRTVRAEDLPISNITLGLTLDDRLLKLSPLNFAMARGTVASDIVINARKSPVVTDYDIRLSPTPMGTLLAGFGVAESGTSGVLKARAQLTGTGNTVHDSLSTANGRIAVIIPKGTMWTRNIQLSIKAKDAADQQEAMASLSQNAGNAGTTSLGALLRAKLDNSNNGR